MTHSAKRWLNWFRVGAIRRAVVVLQELCYVRHHTKQWSRPGVCSSYCVSDVTFLLAAWKFETADASTPVERTAGFQVFTREPEGTVIRGIDGHRAVIAPAAQIACL